MPKEKSKTTLWPESQDHLFEINHPGKDVGTPEDLELNVVPASVL